MNIDESIVEQLVQSTGCDHKLASMLLKFTGGDIKGARRIIEAIPKDIFVVKAKFITQTTGYYGALFFCYDEKVGNVERFISVISDDKDAGKLDIKEDWKNFEAKVYELAKHKKVDSFKIEQFKKRVLDREFISKLSKALKSGKPLRTDAIHSLFIDELYNIFTDTNIALKFDVGRTDAFELKKGQIPEEREAPTEPVEVEREKESKPLKEKKDQSLIVLKVEPILSPVSGVDIKELEFGDDIQVRITDERDIADYLAELLGGKVDNLRVPVFSKVVEVKALGSDSMGVLTQFGPGIMGMFKVTADAKVISKKGKVEKVEEVQKPKGKMEIQPLIVLLGIVFIFIIFIFLILLVR